MQNQQESAIHQRELQQQEETAGNPDSPIQTCSHDETVIIVHGQQNKIDWYGVGLQILTNCFLVGTNVAVYQYFIKRWFHEEHTFLQLIKGIALEPVGLSLLVFYEIIFFLAFVSYQLACFSNPGYMTGKLPIPKHIIKDNSIEYCYRCLDKKWKPKRAHHCKTCRKCVFRMDHHCNWINNCVGVYTQKYFIIFLVYAFIYCLLTMIYLTASALLLYMSVPKVFIFLMEISWRHFICGALWLCSIWFMYMTSEFLSDQLDSISENSTTVESHKNVTGMPNTFWNNVRSVFGDNKLTWLLPIKPAVKCNYLEMLYTKEQIEVIKRENAGFIENIFDDPTDEQYQEINQYKVI